MSAIVDIQTVSITIASAGVFLAAVYYIFQIRHQTKLRQIDLVNRIYSSLSTREYLEAWEEFRSREITDLDEYGKKHGFI